MAKSFAVPRNEPDETENRATINFSPQIFLNCGAWDSGQTDFALVCKGDIVLGSWLTSQIHRKADETFYKRFEDNPKIVNFIKSAQAKSRGFIAPKLKLYHCPSRSFRFTEDELFVFIGDCHINVIREWGPDGFIKGPDDHEAEMGRTRVSLIDDFNDFLDHAHQHTDKEKIIQVGDLYDFWEAQNLFEGAANVLQGLVWSRDDFGSRKMVKQMHAPLLSNPPLYEKAYEFACKQYYHDPTSVALAIYFGIADSTDHYVQLTEDHTSILPWNYNTWKTEWQRRVYQKFAENRPTLRDALAMLFHGSDMGHGFSRFTMPVNIWGALSPGKFGYNETNFNHFIDQVNNLIDADKPINFLDYNEIKRLIEVQYEGECSDGASVWEKFVSIEGNHDMVVENKFLTEVFEKGSMTRVEAKGEFEDESKYPKSDMMDFDCELSLPNLTKRVGKDKCIVVEHGHAWDPYNNEINFFLFGMDWDPCPLHGGFHACRGWTVGDDLIFGDLGYDGDMNDAKFGANPFPISEFGKTIANAGAIAALEEGNHARACAIFDTDNEACKSVRLIVMGHSHVPRLEVDHEKIQNDMYHDWVKKQRRKKAGKPEDPSAMEQFTELISRRR